jgi:hypothetical protein
MRRACKERDERRNAAEAAKVVEPDFSPTRVGHQSTKNKAGNAASERRQDSTIVSESEATVLASLDYDELMPASLRPLALSTRLGSPYKVSTDQIQYCEYREDIVKSRSSSLTDAPSHAGICTADAADDDPTGAYVGLEGY